MNKGLIQKAINRSNLNLSLLCILGILAVGFFGFYNLRYLYNFAFGPFIATPSTLTGLHSASEAQQVWVNIRGDQVLDTGVQYVNSTLGQDKVEASYAALSLGDRLLLVRVPGSLPAGALTPALSGWLSGISAEENSAIIARIEAGQPELKGAFLAYKLDTNDFRTNGTVVITFALLALTACLMGLLTVLIRLFNPNEHPILKSLARLGPLEQVMNSIENELAVPHTLVQNLHLTRNYLVYATKSRFDAARYEDLVWIYKHISTHRSFGIPRNRTCSVMICDRFGTKIPLTAGRKEAVVDEMLKAIFEHAPWTIAGFSKDLEIFWKHERARFLAAIDRRRTEMQPA